MVSVHMTNTLTCLYFSYYPKQHKGQQISALMGNFQSLSQQDCLGRGKVMVMGFDKEFLRVSLFFQKSGFSFHLASLFKYTNDHCCSEKNPEQEMSKWSSYHSFKFMTQKVLQTRGADKFIVHSQPGNEIAVSL